MSSINTNKLTLTTIIKFVTNNSSSYRLADLKQLEAAKPVIVLV